MNIKKIEKNCLLSKLFHNFFSLKIYNMYGKEVCNLISDFYLSGNYSVKWNAVDNDGNELSSGIYIYQLSTKNSTYSNRMVLIK